MRGLSIGVIGGGIGGVAAGAALHQAGFEVTVYEQAPQLREVGVGLMLWPNATRVLQALGVLDRVARRAGANQWFRVSSPGGATLLDIALGQFDVPALCIRRSELLDGLASALPANKVRLGHEFRRFDRTGRRIGVSFAGGQSAEHDILVGADGIRSRVRAQLLGPIEPVFRGYTIWRGIAHVPDALPPGVNGETWGRGSRFGILNTGRGRYTWYATANTQADHGGIPEGIKSELMARFAGWHDPIERLIKSTDETLILKRATCDLPLLPRWGDGRLTLLGDAAHAITPNLGQGGGMAIEDAAVLAKSLAMNLSPELALRRYETIRRKRTRHVQTRARLIGRIGQWENAAVAAGRQTVTRMLPALIFERNLRRVYSYAV